MTTRWSAGGMGRGLMLAGLLAASVSVGGWEAGAAPSAAEKRVSDALGAHIRFLADDLLEGRGTGTAGHGIAARYVAAQYALMGLNPGGESGGWEQSVPLIESALDFENVRAQLTVDGGGTQRLEPNLDFVVSPPFSTHRVEVTAPLVFAGYGVRAPELGYDDVSGLDLKGKIAVVLAKAPGSFPPTALAHFGHARQKDAVLKELGAVGKVVVPTPRDFEESPWSQVVNRARFPAMRWVGAGGAIADVEAQVEAGATLSPQGIGKLFDQAPVSLAEVLKAAGAGKPPTFAMNRSIRLEYEGRHRRLASPNVLGVLPGSDAKRAGETVVLTAHLDHLGRGAAINGDAIYNGAYDNAIGVATLLEVARVLAGEKGKLRRTVVFAAVTAEEKGLRGSEYLARHWPAALGKPVANINLDMVLVVAPTRRYTVLGVEHSSLRGPVEGAARKLGLELAPDPRPDRVSFVRSDQYSFVRRGVPAISPKVADLAAGETSATGMTPDRFLKEHYHRPSDEVSLPRDPESSARFVRFMAEVCRRIANESEAPRWNPGDFFGRTYGEGRDVR